jgi:trk system potassium uptake protein TrkH
MPGKKLIQNHLKVMISDSGFLLMCVGVALLVPPLIIIAYPEEMAYAPSFAIPGLLALCAGLVLWKGFEVDPSVASLGRHQALILVGVGWVMACAFGAAPFFLGGILYPLDSLFEAVSGWTTTGLSMVDVTACPHIFLFWRSFMQFIGGAGLAVIMLTSIIGPKSGAIYSAEARTERLLPAIRNTVRMIVKIYMLYLIIGTVLYYTVGMSWFDSINHCMSALSTGGFSTQAGSIGTYHSIKIEGVTMFLMLLGSLNFAAHYLFLSGEWRKVLDDIELKVMYATVVMFLPIVLYGLITHVYGSLTLAFRHAIFSVISAGTTTGFMLESGRGMGQFGPVVLFSLTLLMLIGGSAGSTAGGLKRYRVGVMAKSMLWGLKKRLLPESAVIGRRISHIGQEESITSDAFMDISLFVFGYMILYVVGVIIFLLNGYSIMEALFEYASAQGTVGLSVGLTGPNMPVLCKIAEIIGMVLGRLELWAVLILMATLFEWIASLRRR